VRGSPPWLANATPPNDIDSANMSAAINNVMLHRSTWKGNSRKYA
jgi:hypothetical protein